MFCGFDLMLWTPKAYLPNQDGATDGDDLNNKRRKLLEPNSEVWTVPYTSHITSALLPHLTLTTTLRLSRLGLSAADCRRVHGHGVSWRLDSDPNKLHQEHWFCDTCYLTIVSTLAIVSSLPTIVSNIPPSSPVSPPESSPPSGHEDHDHEHHQHLDVFVTIAPLGAMGLVLFISGSHASFKPLCTGLLRSVVRFVCAGLSATIYFMNYHGNLKEPSKQCADERLGLLFVQHDKQESTKPLVTLRI